MFCPALRLKFEIQYLIYFQYVDCRQKIKKNLEIKSLFTQVHYILIWISEVSDDQKVSKGGGLEEEGEMIEVIEMSIDELKVKLEKKELLKMAGAGLVGLYWLLVNISDCF